MRDDPSVIALVDRANGGDKRAWDEIVERYAPLVYSICRRYRLGRTEIDDVGQGVWLRLVEHLPRLRDPAALPGWLATTTRRECVQLLRSARTREIRERPLDLDIANEDHTATVDQQLVDAQRNAVLRTAFAQLSERCQRLLSLLLQDPRPPYAEISAALDMPVGSIGPNRARCLDTLRRSPLFEAAVTAEASG